MLDWGENSAYSIAVEEPVHLQTVHRPKTGCGARPTSLWVYRSLFWQLFRDGNLHGSGMSHATTASQKPSFRAPWRVDDAVVGRGNAGWTTSKSGRQNCSQGPPVVRTGRGSPDESSSRASPSQHCLTEINIVFSFALFSAPFSLMLSIYL